MSLTLVDRKLNRILESQAVIQRGLEEVERVFMGIDSRMKSYVLFYLSHPCFVRELMAGERET